MQITFLDEFSDLGRPDDHVQRGKNGRSRMGMTLWSLKHIGRLVVRLKAIEYNEDSFCYLSS